LNGIKLFLRNKVSFLLKNEESSVVMSFDCPRRQTKDKRMNIMIKTLFMKNYSQRRRLAAGLAFEKRRAQLQSPVLEIKLKNYSKLNL